VIYAILRWIAEIALRWFYRDIRVVGRERIPLKGPLLIAVNHQNALVDSLIVGSIVPRHITMTAKATLTDNWIVALIFKWLHVVPLRRSRDETSVTKGAEHDRARNARAFREMTDLLQKDGAVLIFPEGKSHNGHRLEPLKTGLARLALQTRDEAGICGLKILPIGLVFEEKGTPGTVVCARVADVIEMDSWKGKDHLELTDEIARQLRNVSEHTGVPALETSGDQQSNGIFRDALISLTARWGDLTHQLPIRIARNMAVRRSTEADQPAMLTILFGISLVILAYAIQVIVVGFLLRSVFIAGLYLLTLLCGAYCAAFRRYDRRV
jgi:1-acyl-sn-glycerol-3-phosphate acyltransferase